MSIVELFCDVDDFCQRLARWENGKLLRVGRKRGPAPRLSMSEVMTILIQFHQSHYRDFKAYYRQHLCRHLCSEFPGLVSYTRFVELIPSALNPLGSYLLSRFGQTRGVAFKVETWLNDGNGDRVHKSDALEDALARYLEIAVIDLDSDEKPHIIFETLNARGEPLKQSDLVKNTVMYEANVIDDATTARRLWSMFDDIWWRQSTGEPRVERIQLDRFLNHWMVMQARQEVSHQRVAAEFREYVGSQHTPDIETITEGVKTTGVIYKNFLEVRDDDEEIRIFLKRMKILDIAVAMPLLLWLMTSDSPKEHVKQCFQIIESYLVRRMLCGLISHGLGGFFANLLNKLHAQSPTDCISTTVDHFGSSTSTSTMWPNDRMLIERLTTKPLAGTVPRRKMVLEAIEDHMRGEMTEQLIWTDKLTVEHIMPKKWETHWRFPFDSPNQEDIERRNDTVKFLGNLTLTTSKLNSSLSNAPWSEKHGALAKHGTLLLTKSLLSDYSHSFDEDSIIDRTRKMAEIIAQVWRPWEHYKGLRAP